MKKIVSNVLIVSTQLIIGGLFLFMLFSDSNEDNKVVVVENDNLNKMADSVSELFIEEKEATKETIVDETKEVDLVSEEEQEAQKAAAIAAEEAEAARKAQEAAEAEARRQAEEAARKVQEEEAARKKAEEEAARNAYTVDATGYISKPALGFNVTTGNRTYSLSDSDFNIVAGVVACEANKSSKDDVLAVMSVILNRADRRGMSPVQVVSQPYQFSCYSHPGDPSTVASIVNDALNGIRNNSYDSFNGWYTSVSNNYIVEYGNRFF